MITMKRYITILSASVLLGLATNTQAQDIHFSQFYENSILQNPALTGIFSGDYKVGLDYRSQWSSVATPFNTVMVSGETRFLMNRNVGDYLSVGLIATYDKAGTINFASTQVYPALCYNKALGDPHNTYLSVGLTGGYITRSVDPSAMTFSTQFQNGIYSANNPTGEINTYKGLSTYDVGAGVSINSSFDKSSLFNYYLGVSAYNINNPAESFAGDPGAAKLPMKWQFNGGFHAPLSRQFSFTVQANYSIQRPYQEFIFGGLFTYRTVPVGVPSTFAFSFGCLYRYQDAIIPTIKLDFKNTSVGVSYDVNNSSLGTGTGGASATEITLYVRGRYQHRKDPRDNLMCPRFEDDPNPQNTFY